jgi:hypothetical protein
VNNKAELIFMKWSADLADMDRSKDSVEGNFDSLFYSLNKAKVSMEDALIFLDKGIKAHYPSDYIVKNVYKHMKKQGKSESLSEFETSWKQFISAAGKRVFFSIYSIEEAEAEKPKYGNMSASEYRKQQKYADAHPTIDWESIIREQQASEKQEEKLQDIDPSQVNVDIDLGDL